MSLATTPTLTILLALPAPPSEGFELGGGFKTILPVHQVAQTKFFARSYPLCGRKRRSARRNCVVDGDTLWLAGEEIRVMGIDAPETGSTAKCRKERAIGRRATKRFAQIVSSGAIQLQRRGRDRYGRTLAYVSVDGRDAGEALMRDGLAVRYKGRSTAEPWCR